MKKILPFVAIVAAVAFATPALACERHQSHTNLKSVEAVPVQPAPTVIIEPAAQYNPTSEIQAEDAMSRPLGAAYERLQSAAQGPDRLPYAVVPSDFWTSEGQAVRFNEPETLILAVFRYTEGCR